MGLDGDAVVAAEHLSVKMGAFLPFNRSVLAQQFHRCGTDDRRQTSRNMSPVVRGGQMLERYFTSRMTQRRLRFGLWTIQIVGLANHCREQDGSLRRSFCRASRRLHTRTVLLPG